VILPAKHRAGSGFQLKSTFIFLVRYIKQLLCLGSIKGEYMAPMTGLVQVCSETVDTRHTNCTDAIRNTFYIHLTRSDI